MQATTNALVVLVTAPEASWAERLAEALVGEGLAACVNLVPQIRSIYRWQGAVERSDEILCLIKTTRDLFERVRARTVELHPYEVPEVIALPVELGDAAYLGWLTGAVKAPGD
jgi:periplasmic divalent cation tolerance protein